jgi:hypothetical protein
LSQNCLILLYHPRQRAFLPHLSLSLLKNTHLKSINFDENFGIMIDDWFIETTKVQVR